MTKDTDEVHTEFLIQHFPLADVLAFVAARDEVRGIAVPSVERPADLERTDMPTMPAAGFVLVAA